MICRPPSLAGMHMHWKRRRTVQYYCSMGMYGDSDGHRHDASSLHGDSDDQQHCAYEDLDARATDKHTGFHGRGEVGGVDEDDCGYTLDDDASMSQWHSYSSESDSDGQLEQETRNLQRQLLLAEIFRLHRALASSRRTFNLHRDCMQKEYNARMASYNRLVSWADYVGLEFALDADSNLTTQCGCQQRRNKCRGGICRAKVAARSFFLRSC